MGAKRFLQAAGEHELLLEPMPLPTLGRWELDLERNELVWSEEVYRLFELDPGQFGPSYEAFLEAIHPDDREAVNRACIDAVQNGSPYEIVHRLLMPDGRVKFIRERGEICCGDYGRPVKLIARVQASVGRQFETVE